MATKKFTWKNEPNLSGRMRMVQSPRGSDLKVGGQEVAAVRSAQPAIHKVTDWYWSMDRENPLGIVLSNGSGYPDQESAKAACELYIKTQLALPPTESYTVEATFTIKAKIVLGSMKGLKDAEAYFKMISDQSSNVVNLLVAAQQKVDGSTLTDDPKVVIHSVTPKYEG
jgi:hypothetical protein